jgi:aspartate kinase
MPFRAPIVMKFGGTSVADARAFESVARIIAAHSGLRPVVIVSAMSGMTDALVTSADYAEKGRVSIAVASLDEVFRRHRIVAKEILGNEQATEAIAKIDKTAAEVARLLQRIHQEPAEGKSLRDELLSSGELLSSDLLAQALPKQGVLAQQVDPRQCILTNDEHGCAAPSLGETFLKTDAVLAPFLETGVIPVLGGFVGATASGATTTLGRGGSDYSAALIGAALSASEIQIWTDVTGVLTADPRVVPTAQTIQSLSYGEAAELAYFGAKVLHPKTIQPAIEGGIPVRICNSRAPEEPGTLVCAQTETSPRTVKAIAHKAGLTTVQITSARMLGAYGFLRALFEVFERHRTAVDVVTTSEVSVSLSLDDASALPAIVPELQELGSVRIEKGRAIICVVGEGLGRTPGIAARVFSTISDINVTLISQGASSINLTFAIEEEHVNEAVTRLHEAFFGQANVNARPAKY